MAPCIGIHLQPVAAEVGWLKLVNAPNCLKLMAQWLGRRTGTEIANNNDDVRN
jgi:hypothetical protein